MNLIMTTIIMMTMNNMATFTQIKMPEQADPNDITIHLDKYYGYNNVYKSEPMTYSVALVNVTDANQMGERIGCIDPNGMIKITEKQCYISQEIDKIEVTSKNRTWTMILRESIWKEITEILEVFITNEGSSIYHIKRIPPCRYVKVTSTETDNVEGKRLCKICGKWKIQQEQNTE